MQLNQRQSEFASRNINVVAISTDTVATLARFTERRGIKFPLLADKGGKIIKTFGLLNARQGIAYPATYIVDNNGTVRAVLQEQSYQDRPSVDEILATADRALKK